MFSFIFLDNEDDFLTISSNEELVFAWEESEVNSGIIKLFVKEKKQGQSENSDAEEKEHPGVTCDGCQSNVKGCLLYTSPSPRDLSTSRMPSSA